MERLGMRPWKNEIDFQDVSNALLLDEEEDVLKLKLTSESSLKVRSESDSELESDPDSDSGTNILDKRISSLERHVIQNVLLECGSNKAEAARRLGISRTTLWRKLQD